MSDKTMNDIYRDGSEHIACSVCGLCKHCGDCECYKLISQEEMYQRGYKRVFDNRQAIIDKQAAELAALRGFANALIKNSDVMYRYYVHVSARKYGLHDENGNPTKLLTGEE